MFISFNIDSQNHTTSINRVATSKGQTDIFAFIIFSILSRRVRDDAGSLRTVYYTLSADRSRGQRIYTSGEREAV